MKTQIFSLLSIGCSLAFAACSNDDAPVMADSRPDQTTTYFSRSGQERYSTYYKPQVGYVGDPMPFFDPVSNEFRILYLQDWCDGAATFHPIHCVGTTDAASYRSYGGPISPLPTCATGLSASPSSETCGDASTSVRTSLRWETTGTWSTPTKT